MALGILHPAEEIFLMFGFANAKNNFGRSRPVGEPYRRDPSENGTPHTSRALLFMPYASPSQIPIDDNQVTATDWIDAARVAVNNDLLQQKLKNECRDWTECGAKRILV